MPDETDVDRAVTPPISLAQAQQVNSLGRVPVQFRIGVVGHRWLPDDAQTADAVRIAVADIWAECTTTSTEHTTVGLTVVSALAEGADRLVADAGLELGARLEAVLPLPVDDYQQDFSSGASGLRFHELLTASAHVFVVGPRASRDAAYLEAGKRVVDRCDVLLAIWDGEAAGGTGGTGEIVEYADESSTPVRWLEAQRGPGIVGFRRRPDHDDSGNIEPLTGRAFRALDFFNARPVQRDPVGDPSFSPTAASAPMEPFFARADQLSRHYQSLLLRASRAIYALAVLAVATVATQLLFLPDVRWLPWVEVVALAAVTIVLVLGRRMRLLRRWLSARQFAERLRIAAVLSSAGSPTAPAWGPVLADDDWVDRSVDELWTWSDDSIPRPTLRELKQTLIEGWLTDQINYHLRTRSQAIARHRLAVPVTLGLFCLSLIAAILHASGWLGEDLRQTLALISIVAPTAAAAVSGYVGQREYVRRAHRSRQAAESLIRTRQQVADAADYAELHRILDRLQPELAGEAQDWATTTTIHDLEVP